MLTRATRARRPRRPRSGCSRRRPPRRALGQLQRAAARPHTRATTRTASTRTRPVAFQKLSAALRRRLLGEEEVIAAVLAVHPLADAEKFIAEVCWRTYWKGWLEQRPALWATHLAELDEARAAMGRDRLLAERHAAAIDGRTGIAAFDAWARELRDTGYLHNWARMQFASIWLFT